MILAYLVLTTAIGASHTTGIDFSSVAKNAPEVTLSPLYHAFQTQPCQFYGFSFDDTYEELRQMKDIGATCVGSGRIWQPIQDPNAPNGDGYIIEDDLSAGLPLGQTLRLSRPITAIGVCAPTYTNQDSGLTLTLYRLRGNNERVPVASKTFANVTDNSWIDLEFAEQPPGEYLVQATEPTGTGIGLWAVRRAQFDGYALVGERRVDIDFLLRVKYAGENEFTELVGNCHDRIPVRLTKSLWDSVRELGMHCTMFVGDWNNGLFPYYPDWYYEKYPDFCMLDQNGRRIEATMFDKPKGWPPIDHPQQVEGCKRYTSAVVSRLKNEPIPMWIMGGEELYPTYCFPDRWADYQTNAVIHFRKFCAMKYGDIANLNSAWASDFASFDDVEPPRMPAFKTPWVDWTDFRFRAMQERFAWLYQTILNSDNTRLILTPNHGDIYQNISATRMGAMPDLYAQVCDGFETGQIIMDDDPELYNLMYTDSLTPLGKVVSPNRLAYKFSNPRARGGGTSYTPEAARRYTFETLGTGGWFLGLIQWRGSLPDGEWGVKGTPAVQEIKKLFGELKKLEPYLRHMYPVKPSVGLYLSRYTWSLIGFDPLWKNIHVGLVERHVPKAFVYDDSDWTGYPVILSINNSIISSTTAKKLQNYVQAGGVLIIVGKFGEKNEQLRPFDKAILGKTNQMTPVPGINAWTTKIGKGMVIWLTQPRNDELADVVTKLLDDFDLIGPTKVTSRGKISCQRQLSCYTYLHVPIDLSSVKSVGQTFVPRGTLRSIRFSTPTYKSPPPGCALTVRIRLEGPTGEILTEKTIPAEELTDNSTHEIDVSEFVPTQVQLYLEIISPRSLPKERLGVWATKEDWYPQGDLYVDGKRQSGDLQFGIGYAEDASADTAVEVFTLTDGLNYAQIFVNTSSSKAPIEAILDTKNSLWYHLKEVLSGSYLGCQEGAIKYSLTIEPKGAAVVIAMCDVSDRDLREAKNVAAAGSQAWQRLPRQYALTYTQAVDTAIKDSKPAKVVAFAARVVSAIGISASVKSSKTGVIITAKLTDFRGRPVDQADVKATIVPAFGLSVRLSPCGGGNYSAQVPRSALPKMYDFSGRKYQPFEGPVNIDITARKDWSIGATRVFAVL